MMRARKAALAAILAVGLALSVGFGALAQTAGTAQTGATARVASDDYADAIAAAKQQQEDLAAQKAENDAALEDTDAELVAANARLTELQAELPIAQQALDFANAQLDKALFQQQYTEDLLAAAEAEDARITTQLADDQARSADLQKQLGELARATYRGEGQGDLLRLVLGAASSDDFVSEYAAQHAASRTQSNALAEIEQIAATDRNLATRQDAVKVYIGELKKQADEWVATADKARKAAEASKAKIEANLAEQQTLLAQIEAKKQEYLAQQAQYEQDQLDLRLELVRLYRAQSGGTILSDGTWGYPTATHHVTSPYGWRLHPIYHVWRLHSGTDFRAYCGTPIWAAADGQVVWTKWVSGYGNQILLNHGHIPGSGPVYMSSYNHLSAFNVKAGDIVALGQVIGFAGTTGSSTACHLHFEIYVNGNHVDPITVLPPIP
jgi:murein DD-endopeptidase MepM/ murein hydrolase activator NlpD